MNWLQKYTDVSGKLRPIEKNFKIRKKKVLSKNPSKKRCISENSPQHVWLIVCRMSQDITSYSSLQHSYFSQPRSKQYVFLVFQFIKCQDCPVLTLFHNNKTYNTTIFLHKVTFWVYLSQTQIEQEIASKTYKHIYDSTKWLALCTLFLKYDGTNKNFV